MWKGKLYKDFWLGNTRRYAYWKGEKGIALALPAKRIGYGYLYNGYAAIKEITENDVGYSLAPEGWRLPTYDDIIEFNSWMDASSSIVRNILVDRKEPDPHPRFNSTIDIGASIDKPYRMSILAAGFRRDDGFVGMGGALLFISWTQTEGLEEETFYAIGGVTSFSALSAASVSKKHGLPVRFIRVNDTGYNAGDTVEDIDGNVYNTVRMGNQIWTIQQAATTKYRNGEPIPNLQSSPDWYSTTNGAYCAYANNENLAFVYFDWVEQEKELIDESEVLITDSVGAVLTDIL